VTNKPKNKGRTEEHRTADSLNLISGWKAWRVPMSGALPGMAGDVILTSPDGHDFRVEVKIRKSGFKTLYKYLKYNEKTKRFRDDFLFVRENRKPALVVMSEDTFAEILEHWQAGVVQAQEAKNAG